MKSEKIINIMELNSMSTRSCQLSNILNDGLQTSGVLSDVDILEAISYGDIFINSFDSANLTPLGYNFSPSEIVLSIKSGFPLRVHSKGCERFVWVRPNDTVLISTKEYLAVGKNVMGTFHSKVKLVSKGFGHISTTLDPGWNGPLLISLNNPTSRKLKLIISRDGKPLPFVTLVFYRLLTPSNKAHDNPPNRADVLMEHAANPSTFKRFIFSKSYEQYLSMIKKLNRVANIEQTELDNISKEVEQFYCNMLSQELAFSSPETVMTAIDCMKIKLKADNKYYTLSCLLDKTQSIVKERILGNNYLSRENQEAINNMFIQIHERIILHITRSSHAYVWKQDYSECTEIIRNHRIDSWWISFLLNDWKKILIRSIIFIVLITLAIFILYNEYLTEGPKNGTLLLGAILAIVSSIITYHYTKER